MISTLLGINETGQTKAEISSTKVKFLSYEIDYTDIGVTKSLFTKRNIKNIVKANLFLYFCLNEVFNRLIFFQQCAFFIFQTFILTKLQIALANPKSC